MTTLLITHPCFVNHDTGAGHPERPDRMRAIDNVLAHDIYKDLVRHEAPLRADIEEAIGRVHPGGYYGAIKKVEPKTKGELHHIDGDTVMSDGSWEAAVRAASSGLDAIDRIMGGQAANAFCQVRPPGHHAESHRVMGFCFFNNVAVGIRHALTAHGIERVALIDFDVHHGNGSEDIFRGDERVLMCSIFETGIYPFTGENATGLNMVNVGLPSRSGSDRFREAVTDQWLPALEAFKPEMIYISAGFDAHREDDMGNLALVEADYEWVTKQIMAVAERHCQGRVISCLEGGYVMSPLARSAAAHVKVLIGAD